MRKPLRYSLYYLGSLALLLIGATSLPYPYGLFVAGVVLLVYFFAAIFAMDMMLPWFNVLTPNIYALPKGSHGEVCLTFDDGPNPDCTPAILKILEEKKVPAAFFCIGENVARSPELVHEIVKRGHIVANHTQNHRVLPLLKVADAEKEMREGLSTIEKIVPGTKYLRFPKGYKSISVHKLATKLGYVPIGFSYPAYDVENPPAQRIVDLVLGKVKSGDILLFHDGCAPGKPSARSSLVAALPEILDGIQAKGLKVVPLSKYF